MGLVLRALRADHARAPVGRRRDRRVGRGRFREVSVDGQPIDLAYTYVHAPGDDGWTNLAKLVGCPASGVPGGCRRPPSPRPTDAAAGSAPTPGRARAS